MKDWTPISGTRCKGTKGDNMDQHLISIIEIADAHGRRRQSIHKLVNRLGIKTIKRKSDQARGQAISYITADDYEELRGLLNGMDNSDSEAPSEGSGVST
jgi:hypothetical protein